MQRLVPHKKEARFSSPGIATISHVADRAGVSTATVSHVINNTKKVHTDTRRRVLAAIEALDYRQN